MRVLLAGAALMALLGAGRRMGYLALCGLSLLGLLGDQSPTVPIFKMWEVTEVPRVSQWVRCLAFSADGKHLAVASHPSNYNTELAIWDWREGRLLARARFKGEVDSLALSPEGDTAAVGTSGGGEGSTVQLLDTAQLKKVRSWPADRGGYQTEEIAFVPQSGLVTLALSRVRTWDIPTARELLSFDGGFHLAVASRSDRCATSSITNAITVRSLSTGLAVQSIQNKEFKSIWALCLAADGALLVVQFGDGARVYNVASGEEIAQLPLAAGRADMMTFSQDGRLLVGASMFGSVYIWDTKDWRLVKKFAAQHPMVTAIALSPDGRTLAVGTNLGGVQLTDLSSFVQTAPVKPATEPPPTF